MKVLLDTHVFLWYYSGALELSAKSRSFIDQSETLNLSIASLWEIGIKHSLGKLDLGAPIEHFFEDVVAKGFPIVGISPSHVLREYSEKCVTFLNTPCFAGWHI